MKERELEAVRRALEEEFGVRVEEPTEVRRALEARVATMNPVEQAAFDMKVGRAFRELEEVEQPVRRRYTFLGFALLSAALWFVWRPLAAVVAILGVSSQARHLAIRGAPDWTPARTVVFGATYGLIVGVMVFVASIFAVRGMLGTFILAALGFLAAGYPGYGVMPQKQLQTPEEEKRLVTLAIAVFSYVAVGLALYFVVGLER